MTGDDFVVIDGNKIYVQDGNILSVEGINNIFEIKGLDKLIHLKGLHIWNSDLRSEKLSKIEFLEELKDLEYLDLGGNRIVRIEGLETLKNLKVLNFNNPESD